MQSDGSKTLSSTTQRLQSLSAVDTRGKHRIHAELKRLEQETRFLEDPGGSRLDLGELRSDGFLSPEFDSESYISDHQTFVPFDTLQSELQSYLAFLNHELIDLINCGYADFINLSTKLVDVDSAVVRMRALLVELREKIEQFRDSVQNLLMALTNKLK